MTDNFPPRSRRPRRMAAFAAIGAAAIAAAPASAQIVPDGGLSIGAAVRHDLGSAALLIRRQLAIPFSGAYGFAEMLALLGLALVLGWPLRLWVLDRLTALLRTAPLEKRLAISVKAVGTVLVTTLIMIAAGRLALAAITLTIPLLPETAIVAHGLAIAIGSAGLGLGLGRALQSRDDKAWRPMALPSGLGTAIGLYPFAAGAMLGLTNVIEKASRVLHATQTSWAIAQGLIVLVETLVIVRFLVLAGHARERVLETAAPDEKDAAVPAVFGATVVVWGVLLVACGAIVFGHMRFAMFVLQELLWTGLVLTLAWLLTGLVDALLTQLLDADRGLGRFATSVVGMERARLKQFALLGSALLTVLIWLVAIGLVAAPLHGTQAAVLEQVRPTTMLRALESLDLSPGTLVTALFVLFVGIAFTRMVRGWLETRFLPSTSLDIGMRNSIVTGLTYLGVIVALLTATNMLGLQLEKITLIASALSVGIGFGLQSIIQNFVSGLILLVERPVKVGDWVAVSGAEGTIRKIRVRATELVTADGGKAIVPNSSFISSNVSNRADTHMAARVDLTLTVTGCPTAARARDMLLELVAGCGGVRNDPAPSLTLTTLGDAQWVFAVRVYAEPGASVSKTRSDLLFWLAAQTEGKDMKLISA